MSKFTSVLAAAGFAMLPLASQAATPTLGDVLKASGITANGYIDFGNSINNRGTDGYAGVGGLQGAQHGSFRLNQVGLTVNTALSDNFSGVLDVLAGQDAQAIPSDAGSDIVFKQAYINYTSGNLTVMGGRFITLAGSEVINSSQNANATRGLLFSFLQPSTHTGVRATYAIGKTVTVTGGVVNSALATGIPILGAFAPIGAGGAAGGVVDNNTQKTLEAQVTFAPFDGFSNALTYYRGIEGKNVADPAPHGTAAPYLVDLVSSLQVTKALSLGLNYDFYDTQFAPTDSRMNGVALYGNLQVCDTLRLGGRGEFVTLANGPGLVPGDSRFNAFEYTLTGGYSVAKNMDIITDVRFDKITGPQGLTPPVFGQGTFGTASAKNGNALTSLTIKAIYKF